MYRQIIFAIVGTVLMFAGCTTTSSNSPHTQLQVRAFQTHLFESHNQLMVMKAVLDTLQDEGFIVKNAVVDLGLITASKELDIENKNKAFLSTLFKGSKARWKKNSIVEVSTNVSSYGRQTKVRSNFQVKVFDNKGGVVSVKQVNEPTYYQKFFMKIDKGLYLQKENL